MSAVRQKTESSAKVLQTEIKNLTMQPLEGFEIAPCYGLKFKGLFLKRTQNLSIDNDLCDASDLF